MFVRVKNVGPYQYMQIAQNRGEAKRVERSIIATLGRLDKLTASGAIDQLLRSAARFAERLMVLAEHFSDSHDLPGATVVSVGPRRWSSNGCGVRPSARRSCASCCPPATITSMSNARCS